MSYRILLSILFITLSFSQDCDNALPMIFTASGTVDGGTNSDGTERCGTTGIEPSESCGSNHSNDRAWCAGAENIGTAWLEIEFATEPILVNKITTEGLYPGSQWGRISDFTLEYLVDGLWQDVTDPVSGEIISFDGGSSSQMCGYLSNFDLNLYTTALRLTPTNYYHAPSIRIQVFSCAAPATSTEITGTSGFRILSSPVPGTIYSDLLEELWTQGAEGSDQSTSNPNIWTWNNSWNALSDLSTDNYTAGSGVLVYVYSDTDFDGTDDLPVTLTVDGTQNTSSITIAANEDSWNLLGNPYGYSLSIQQLAADNANYSSAMYIWDNATSAYKIHNGQTGDIADGLIAPFQGFWVYSNSGGTDYTFTLGSISNNQGTNYRTTTDNTPGSAIFSFHVGDYTSSLYLSFDPNGHINLDNADALRLLPLEPVSHLTSMIHESSKSLSINNLPYDLSTDISMDMDVMMLNPTDDGYATQAEQVNLTWDITNLPEGITLVLRNNITGQNINLTGYPSASINLPSKGSFLTSGDFMATYPVVGQSQFTLSVYGTLAAADDDDILPERLTLHSAYPNPFNPSTIISFDLPDADMVSLDIFDIAGRQVASLISEYMIPGSHQINWNPGQLSSGIYLVNLVVGTETFNQKITFIK